MKLSSVIDFMLNVYEEHGDVEVTEVLVTDTVTVYRISEIVLMENVDINQKFIRVECRTGDKI